MDVSRDRSAEKGQYSLVSRARFNYISQLRTLDLFVEVSPCVVVYVVAAWSHDSLVVLSAAYEATRAHHFVTTHPHLSH